MPAINRLFDRLVRTEVSAGGWTYPAFAACGQTGFAAAIVLAVALTWYAGLSLAILLLMTVTGALTYLAVVAVTRMLTGTAQLTYYHHELAILAATALVLRIAGQPVLAYLDISVLGIGVVLACGRMGCLLVGCCHGRPHRWGVCYRAKHAVAGFPAYLAGVRLFPIQAVELLMVAAVVAIGTTQVIRGDRPGDALTWYVAIYGAGRFFLEFARGDIRRYLAGFSEAQWTSAVCMCAAVVAEQSGLLPFHVRDLVAAVVVLAAMAAVAAWRHLAPSAVRSLSRPEHLKEVADALDRAFVPGAAAPAIRVSRTSLGIQISGSCIDGVNHYAFSGMSGPLPDEMGDRLADLILMLKPEASRHALFRGREGVLHLVADFVWVDPARDVASGEVEKWKRGEVEKWKWEVESGK